MRFFAQLEAACETAVERAFAIAFPSALEPIAVARKLVAAFESTDPPPGRVGRRFVVRMSASDQARLATDLPYLQRQWSMMLARLVERSGTPERSPAVVVDAVTNVPAGTVTIAVEALAVPLSLRVRLRRGFPHDRSLALSHTPILVGRDAASDIVLMDPRASRRHLEIFTDGERYRFRDLGSSNGTRVNGVAQTAGELALGDVVSVGDSELVVEAEPAS